MQLQIIVMKENREEIDRFVRTWRGKVDSVRVKLFSNWGGQLKEIEESSVDGYRYQNGKPRLRPPCHYLWKSVVVLWDGRVVPCCRDFDGKITLGDLKRQSLTDIWRGSTLQALRRMHLDGEFENTLCDDCFDITPVSPRRGFPLDVALRSKIARTLLQRPGYTPPFAPVASALLDRACSGG